VTRERVEAIGGHGDSVNIVQWIERNSETDTQRNLETAPNDAPFTVLESGEGWDRRTISTV